jgi:hypothetical protein
MKKKEKDETDYESLYYKTMKENLLLKDKKISFEFSDEEINFLRQSMYYELKDMQFEMSHDEFHDEEEKEENKMLGKKQRNMEFFNTITDEKRLLVENIIKKLRFEL